MAILNKQIIEELGITLSDADYALLEEHFETTLNERVTNEIVLSLTPEQAQQLADMQQADDATILQWLQTNVTELTDIVTDEIDILLGELAENSEALG